MFFTLFYHELMLRIDIYYLVLIFGRFVVGMRSTNNVSSGFFPKYRFTFLYFLLKSENRGLFPRKYEYKTKYHCEKQKPSLHKHQKLSCIGTERICDATDFGKDSIIPQHACAN